MIRFDILGSGSKGNATLVYDETTLFQIDMGISLKRVKMGLLDIHRSLSDIKGVLITHEHSDHIGTLGLLPSSIPVYSGEGTLKGHYRTIENETPFSIGDFTIFPLSTSHDAKNPMGFLVSHADEKLVYITDTGCVPEGDLPFMRDADYYIFESNHDYRMLMESSRPPVLKRRIHGDHGHLSNAESALCLSSLVGSGTKAIYLAHISEECNSEKIAFETYRKVFSRRHKSLEGIRLVCAKQWEPTKGGDE
ncbi:MAG: MBL fold metallo-hydrolase [Bacilli bacterium]|jgi:phosphoribosyl 1,2-cyclic phosphodiesterase|nr:MBL fold metallo-hydrolase [Bacilli bacterium]